MDAATRQTLQEAYALVKARDYDAARTLIKPVLAAHPDMIDAWWLAAYAATTSADRRLALVQVLRLNPDHGPARVLLDRLNAQNPDDIDALAKELPMPPAGSRRRPEVGKPRGRNRWVWNVVLVFGCLSFSFAGMALVSSLAGLTYLDDAVDDVSSALGIERKQETFGTIPGGDPARPYEIPVTKQESAPVGKQPIVGDLKQDEAHIYTFGAQRGQEIFALLQFTVAGDAHYVMELWDSGERWLATAAGEYNSGTASLIYEVRQTGSFSLVIIGRPGGPRGSYALGLDVVD